MPQKSNQSPVRGTTTDTKKNRNVPRLTQTQGASRLTCAYLLACRIMSTCQAQSDRVDQCIGVFSVFFSLTAVMLFAKVIGPGQITHGQNRLYVAAPNSLIRAAFLFPVTLASLTPCLVACEASLPANSNHRTGRVQVFTRRLADEQAE